MIGRATIMVAALVMVACSTLPDLARADIVAGTNEPFHSVEIRGDEARLTSLCASPRRLRVTRRETMADGAVIDAADAEGTLRLLLSETPCEDDMSGAAFPLTATLTLDGRSHRGCARRRSDPAPRPIG